MSTVIPVLASIAFFGGGTAVLYVLAYIAVGLPWMKPLPVKRRRTSPAADPSPAPAPPLPGPDWDNLPVSSWPRGEYPYGDPPKPRRPDACCLTAPKGMPAVPLARPYVPACDDLADLLDPDKLAAAWPTPQAEVNW